MIFSFEKLDNESEEAYIWRIGQAKDAGLIDLNWSELTDIINEELDCETPYAEAAYRKPYQGAKRFYEAGVFNDLDADKYIDDLQDQKLEIQKEKQKLFDERTAIRKRARDTARIEESIDILERKISENGRTTLPSIEVGAKLPNVGVKKWEYCRLLI